MNCRTVRMMAIAIGLCVITATASNALAAKEKAKHGVIAEAITMAKAAEGTNAAVTGKIKITEKQADKTDVTNTYELSDAVSVQVNGEPGKLEDLAAGDKIGFKLDENKKVSVIMKGHKKKAPK